ncbi:probable tRNA N6-adenosine threonylcarbamoyltransferase, mitochondrial [Photinus pyralis]|uniref:probable tRNA N6-adenosine threonylcarbamoyltransferase, mitochondrial n=1 Tax=Photinus pyralis TaxID=7054 RepID=UPI0012673686|nr:probable tRNA N6-adenosine threonylcarbamoyltransferase, mitochondrial [Photinus pyralis]
MTQLLKLICNNSRRYSNIKRGVILGIETSCDDTGCAVVDTEGNILGEALNSQHLIHLKHGGIIPPIAQDLHRKNIENVVADALKEANLSCNEVDAIATTVKPGLPLSLTIGTKYGKHLCRTYNKPFIPIHHMEAHALTARMHDSTIEFPFLVLLISGGHCLLAIAQDVDKFLLMGQSFDDAPGEVFDKMARRLKLKDILEYSEMSGGQAIECAASKATNPLEFNFTPTLLRYRDCNFSFAGNKNQCVRHILAQERKHGLSPDAIIPGVNNLCAGLLLVMTRHLCHRVQRGMEYAALKHLIPSDRRTLVVSGGVACNNFVAAGLQVLCDGMEYKLARPPHKLCTDNGVMIAWNGIERWRANKGITTDLDSITIEKSSPLGEDVRKDVELANIKPKWIKLTGLVNQNENVKKDVLQNNG